MIKFLERGLIILGLIGYYLAVWDKPVDHSVIFISAAGLAIIYCLGMPFLLRDAHKQVEPTNVYNWQDIVFMVLFGIVSAYTVFAIVYHCQGNMTSRAIIENCGLLLLVSTVLARWRLRKTKKYFYQKIRFRIAVLAAFCLVSLLVIYFHSLAAASQTSK